jgi:hypothetical protein
MSMALREWEGVDGGYFADERRSQVDFAISLDNTKAVAEPDILLYAAQRTQPDSLHDDGFVPQAQPPCSSVVKIWSIDAGAWNNTELMTVPLPQLPRRCSHGAPM